MIRATFRSPAFARSRQYSAACRMVANVPRRCTRITASHSSIVMLASIRSRRMPALFTTMSRAPNASTAVRTRRRAPSQSETSSSLATAWPPAARIASTTSAAGPSERPATVDLTSHVVHHDLGSLPRQLQGVSAPYATPRPGDDGDAPLIDSGHGAFLPFCSALQHDGGSSACRGHPDGGARLEPVAPPTRCTPATPRGRRRCAHPAWDHRRLQPDAGPARRRSGRPDTPTARDRGGPPRRTRRGSAAGRHARGPRRSVPDRSRGRASAAVRRLHRGDRRGPLRDGLAAAMAWTLGRRTVWPEEQVRTLEERADHGPIAPRPRARWRPMRRRPRT